MPIYNSSNEIKTITNGSNPVDAVYVSSTKVFPTEAPATVTINYIKTDYGINDSGYAGITVTSSVNGILSPLFLRRL